MPLLRFAREFGANTRKFLLQLRYFSRYRKVKRRYRATLRELEAERARNAREIKKLTDYYETRLETERQKIESLLLTSTDRVFQAMKLNPVSHVTIDAAQKAEAVLRPPDIEPSDPVGELTAEERNFYLDEMEGFLEYETGENGRTDAEALALWEKDFKKQALLNARKAIIY